MAIRTKRPATAHPNKAAAHRQIIGEGVGAYPAAEAKRKAQGGEAERRNDERAESLVNRSLSVTHLGKLRVFDSVTGVTAGDPPRVYRQGVENQVTRSGLI